MLALLIFYCVAQVALGLWIGRKVRTSGDFFVAGRSLSPGLLFATMVAANVGAGSTVGAAGRGYSDGLSAWWWVGSAGIGSLVLAFVVGPRIWKIAQQQGLKTTGDYLDLRYGRDVRTLVAALLWFGSISILSGQLIALAWVLNVVAGIDKTTGAIIGGVVATAYFAAGGLLTSAYVNFVQLLVMLVGFFTVVPIAIGNAGGFDAMKAATSTPPEMWNFFQNGASGLPYLALLVPAFIISPGLMQKVYGARDESAVRKGVFWNAMALLVFAFVPPLMGLAARALHPNLTNPELAMPTLFMSDLPPLLGALGLAAVVSAEISTADAVLFMLATSLSQDLYKGWLRPEASDADVLRVARCAAVAGGILGVGVAIYASSVISVLSLFYSVLSVSLFVPVAAGLFIPSAGRPHAFASIVAGVATLLFVHVTTSGRGYPGFSPVLCGLIASALACALALAVVRTPPATKAS